MSAISAPALERRRAQTKAWCARNKVKCAEYTRRFNAKNPEKRAEYAAKYYAKNKERLAPIRKDWRLRNKPKCAGYTRAYHQKNPGRRAAICMARHSRMLKATPAWADMLCIRETYTLAKEKTLATGAVWQVDHIVPLRGKLVCGLHVHYNLQVIPAIDNRRKNNRFWPNMPEQVAPC